MPDGPYAEEVQIVQKAIARLKEEPDTSLIKELEEEQLAAGTNLEWYGITASVFERFLESRELSRQTRIALKNGVDAVRVIFTSPN
jgi:hypothetical protein